MSCPTGDVEQQWWLTKEPTARELLKIQGLQCGSWLAFIEDGASARYDDVDLGMRDDMRLRVVVAADDAFTHGGTLNLFADSDMTTSVNECVVRTTGGWFNWVVVDCGPLALKGGSHSLTFRFSHTDKMDQYSFNLAAFGVVRPGSPDCTVTGPKLVDRTDIDALR